MRIRIDLRDIPVDRLDDVAGKLPTNSSYLLTAWQWSAWNSVGQHIPQSEQVVVMVPDFLYYARLISTEQAKQIISLPRSTSNLIKSLVHCIPTGLRSMPDLAKGKFWAGAEALLAYDMGIINSGFNGEVILHYNIADFTWLFEPQKFFHNFIKLSGNLPWGIATQQLPKALSACTRWNQTPARILYTTGYENYGQELLNHARSQTFSNTAFSIDLTLWPVDLICHSARSIGKDHAELLVTPHCAVNLSRC